MPKVEFECGICQQQTFIDWEPTPSFIPIYTTGCAHAGQQIYEITGHERWLAFIQPNHDYTEGD